MSTAQEWPVWELREGLAERPEPGASPMNEHGKVWAFPCIFAARRGELEYGEVVVGGLFDRVWVVDCFDSQREHWGQWNPPAGKKPLNAQPQRWRTVLIDRPVRFNPKRLDLGRWIKATNAWEALILESMSEKTRKEVDTWVAGELDALRGRWDQHTQRTPSRPPRLQGY